MEENKQQVTTSDVIKHYAASVIIYGIILGFIITCPLLYEAINNENFDYTAFFFLYYLGYIVIAPVVFLKLKPKSILESRSIAILNYIKRQFKKNETTEEFLKKIEPKENEKQAFTILFMQTFFGVYSVNLLCNAYANGFSYDIEFLKEMYSQAVQYASMSGGLLYGTAQYIVDTGDMWLKMILTVSTLVLTFSYLTELDIFKNKIKSVDTTPLGIITCIACYYPITLLTDKILQVTPHELLPVSNPLLLAALNLLIVLVNLFGLFAILRLGTKSGNLTNRGIVTGFPYNIVRHPSYTMYILYIILTSIPLYMMNDTSFFEKVAMTIATLAWIYLYYLRSITEERHLIKDPEYQKYVEKVKYRFIPKVF